MTNNKIKKYLPPPQGGKREINFLPRGRIEVGDKFKIELKQNG